MLARLHDLSARLAKRDPRQRYYDHVYEYESGTIDSASLLKIFPLSGKIKIRISKYNKRIMQSRRRDLENGVKRRWFRANELVVAFPEGMG